MSSVFKKLFYECDDGRSGSCEVYGDPKECPDPRLYILVDGRAGYIPIGNPNARIASPIRCFVNSAGREFALFMKSPWAGEEEG